MSDPRDERGEPGSLDRPAAPDFAVADAEPLARELFGVAGRCSELPSYIDRNFRVDEPGGASWVLRIATEMERRADLDLQNRMMRRLEERAPGIAPVVRSSVTGRDIERATGRDGREHHVRLVSFLPGELMSECQSCGPITWRSLGELLARLDRGLEGLEHEAQQRELRWDLARADWTLGGSRRFADLGRRALVEAVQLQFFGQVQRRAAELPQGWIHNDANDQNIVLAAVDDAATGGGGPRVAGVFDFGDVVHSARIYELAVACAYAVFGHDDPLAVMGHICAGYHGRLPLEEVELEVLLPATCMRLVQSVTISAGDALLDPDNLYVHSSEAPAWSALERLATLEPRGAVQRLRQACGLDLEQDTKPTELDPGAIRDLRHAHLGPSLSLAYRDSLELVRGRGAWLFDREGRAYLDGVNNVCHVGHCHPRVVAAGQAQMARLNTNTRYLHENVVRYAERLTALFPEPLSVCYFVNSGSEANELAVRLARCYTGRRDMLVIDGGYHGNTTTLIDLSPYKHDGPGGAGAPDWVSVVECPDTYRGRYRAADPEAGAKYASQVAEACASAAEGGSGIAGFLAEPLIGCGGQIVPPAGYLRTAFEHARAAGAVCIADEVQIGFGRVGSHWWGFELDGARPDIVTLGKPMGDGHPLGAVVTTPEIAAAFANGMEYFNTFGGNPVSSAIGSAVLDVLEEENLRENAARVGERLRSGFEELAGRHACIGDVRGVGLYLGVELVQDRTSREPAPERLTDTIEAARRTGLLLSSDGPHHNVLKIKPPICWTIAEADLALAICDRSLAESRRP